ncbi:glycine betaine/proline transport system substrate-binding protein [Pseudomonas sp. 2848]|uniref:glycine betaine ABC transporter substrate-binding protein n=1 Tax=Pseudomonas sp. 2848 TaxID=2183926 RepID=UPI000DAC56AD|nr:glycine betaine ABC transporter substrate-binding protein [Pseudomonas sp. 2848]PZW77413.1 glycine betaine/proline transport system substrate-binding protein [Pseudomonas sp. 2848]
MRPVKRRQFIQALATVALLPAALARGHMQERGANMVRLGVTDLSFHHATAAVVALVLQRMGFVVKRSSAPHERNFERLREGAIDMLASAWIPSSHGLYKAQVEEQVATRELGLHYTPYALWGVPDYVPESMVASVEDLLDPSVSARMHKQIQGIGAGAGITRFSLKMMVDYDLVSAGYSFRTGTQEQCVAAYEQLVREGKWGIVPLWHPQFLHHSYRIRELKDPKGLLGSVDRAVLLARDDRLSGFSAAQLQVLDNIRLDNTIVAELDHAINRCGASPDEAARAWFEKHPQVLASWLRPVS